MTNDSLDLHRPTGAFRDYLESEVIHEFRRRRTFRRLRAAAVIIVSVGIGMSTTLASAQVREKVRKDSVLEAANADGLMAALRYGLAKAQLAEEQKQVSVGARSASALSEAEIQLGSAEEDVARTILNIQEIEATGRSPRDDLNAPLVNGRDFFKQRLEAEMMATNKRLQVTERDRDEAKRRVAVGTVEESEADRLELQVARTRAQLVVVAERIKARDEFLEKGTSVEELTKRGERVETQQLIIVAQQELKLAQAALARLERRRDAGASTELDVLRARLTVAESELEVKRLSQRLQQLR
jgi:outer membrane protein TolC